MRPLNIAAVVVLAGALLATGASAAQNTTTLARGEQVYARCAGCHAIEGHRTGPQHCGLFGRRAGTAPGYNEYSPAMRESQWVWDEKSLSLFLQDPMKALPGTSMGYAGVKDDAERSDLIAWLKQSSRTVQCKPVT
jgi:cytochrome c